MKTLSRKEQEYQTRREYILNAAREIFSQKGFAETTMEEIAERAEFGKGTIYNYFPSKQDLFFTLIEDGVNAIIQLTTSVANKDITPVEKIEQLFREQLRHFQENVGLFRIVHLENKCLEFKQIHKKTSQVRDIVLKIIEEGMAKGYLKKGDPQMLRVMYSGFVHASIFLYWSEIKQNVPLAEAEISEMLDYFLNGIVNKEQV